MNASDRLIVALDVSTADAASKIVTAVGDSAGTYKIGMQLYTAAGPRSVKDLVSSSRKVFLDLKYHDIPNTVAGAVKDAAALGVDMLTVHAMGGGKMLRAAVESARAANRNLKVLAVTVLTSIDDDELNAVGVPGLVSDEVVVLAKLALSSGCAGVVASAQEASELRRQFGDKFLIVTPGVRPAGSDHGDQARVVTPAQAIEAGASHIVVGRPIVEAANPAQAVKEILAQMSLGTAAISV
jgi:orotidine-5'-phosphate decarboxylase